MRRLVAMLSMAALGFLLVVSDVRAQDAETQAFDFSLSDAFVHTLAQQNTILFHMQALDGEPL